MKEAKPHMADEWIKMRHRLLGEAEVKEMAIRLKVTRQHVAGCLLGVWSHADQYAVERPDPKRQRDICPDDDGTNAGTNVPATEGYLAFSTVDDIDHAAMQPGFAQVMADVGWLQIYPDGIGFPQYEVHHSSSAKKRASEQKKKSKQRSKKQPCPPSRPDNVPPTTGQSGGPEGEGEGEREEELESETQKQKKMKGGGGLSGERRASGGATPQGVATTASMEKNLEGKKSREEHSAEVDAVLGAWDDIAGVSHEHAEPGDDGLVYDRRVVELLRARLRDPHFRDNWRTGLNFVRSSRLCRGMVEPATGFDSPWRISLKWFCGTGNLQKILDGSRGGNAEGLTEEEDEDFFESQRRKAIEAAGGVA